MLTRPKKMFRFFSGVIASIFLLVVFVLPAQALEYDRYDYFEDDMYVDLYGWSIDHFDSEIEVREDASFLVTETIDVTFNAEKHGIYRDIPVVYRDHLGNRQTIDLNVQGVLLDGEEVQVDIYKSGGDRTIKIGNPSLTITGEHEYTIVYEVERALLYSDTATTLYWNVTGTDWEVPINESSTAIIFPDGLMPTQWSCYTGAYGSTSQDCGSAQDDNIIAFATDGFMTVSVDVPAGVIWRPTSLDRVLWFLMDNWAGVIPLMALCAMFFWWTRAGRDPKRNDTIIAQYDPPDGLWAVYVGSFLSHQPSQRLLSSMVIQLASKGYLDMDVKGNTKKKHPGNITIIKKKEGDDLDEAHKLLFDLLFKKKTEVKLNKVKNRILPSDVTKIKRAITRKLVDDGYFVRGSFIRQVVGILISFPFLFFSPMAFAFIGLFVGIACVICGALMLVLGLLMPKVTPHGAEVRYFWV
ncbi:DUF2207 domain-containing protein [Candidatus Uhrbacteria bacterium]|nr:DUF2207 domain-containing protein [Candidatus Uhrbacteria bacterium]